jgi:uncharacterized protein (TIGR00159 family)
MPDFQFPEFQWIFSRLDARAVVDIIVVTFIIYWLLGVAQGTRAALIIRGMLILVLAIWLVSRVFELAALGWLFKVVLPVLLVAIPVIFQPELRRVLEQIGHTERWLRTPFPASSGPNLEQTIDEISRAAGRLSRSRYGALMVLERETGLQDYADRGVPLDAAVTQQLLINIFFPNSPLHDGAVIIRQDRILAAGVVLPLTENVADGGRLGTRHRAAIGITEESDALAVVVSEETGRISVAHSGRLVENLDQERLRRALRSLLRLDRTDQRQRRSPAGAVLRRNGRARVDGNETRTATTAKTADSKGSVSWELESDS